MTPSPIFIDIDGTLTDAPGRRWGRPAAARIDKVKGLLAAGVDVVIWSAGGRDYAREFADAHGLAAATCIGKPACVVDDNPTIRPAGRMPIRTPEEFFG